MLAVLLDEPVAGDCLAQPAGTVDQASAELDRAEALHRARTLRIAVGAASRLLEQRGNRPDLVADLSIISCAGRHRRARPRRSRRASKTKCMEVSVPLLSPLHDEPVAHPAQAFAGICLRCLYVPYLYEHGARLQLDLPPRRSLCGLVRPLFGCATPF
ncbi:hypothetical protein [Pseudomonas paraeruginosa]|uniref:hypothetical protein n=1 Tax=Pseudomonas paraeruginosa TaxID=2994495 RepID=UPI0039FD1FAC